MMKKSILTLVIAMASAAMLFAQTLQHRTCSTMENLQRLEQENPGLAAQMQQIEVQTAAYVNSLLQNQNTTQSVITVPVVFHVVYKTAAQNISDAQCIAQLNQLNLDYAHANTDAGNAPAPFLAVAANTQIQFCLAQRDPSGNATTGVIHKVTTTTSFTDNDNVKHSSTGGDDAWPAASYLNIWSCNLGNSLLGYAQFPGGPAATDGVVFLYSSIGSMASPGTASPYNLGRTATHEIGHWLNLHHIWGDANCGDDLVADTPTQQTDNFGCPTYPHLTCGNTTTGDMFVNYMDYTDDGCMNMFTAGQSARINAIFTSGGSRFSILSSLGCSPPSVSCGLATGLGATAITTTGATLNWAVVSGAQSYNVQYRATGTGTWISTTSSTNSKAITGLSASTTYEFQVQTVCASTSSAFTSSATFVTPAPPTCGTASGLNATAVTTTSATLNWTAGSNATNYNIQYRATGTTTWSTTSSIGNATSVNIAGLTASTTYEFQVQTICSFGSSAFTSSATFVTPAVPTCGTASGLNATAITATTATLQWTAGSSASSYNVQYRATGTPTWSTTSSVGSATSVNITGLTASTTYEFQVQTICSFGSSAFTSSATFVTLAPPTCGNASGLNATSVTSSTATLNWTAGGNASSYTIQYRIVGSGTWISTTSGTSPKAITGLTASSNYEWQVQTVCSFGSSAFTASATFTTPAASTGCSDQYEPNNTSGSPATIATNTDIIGLISTTSDADWFKFTTTSPNTRIKITLTNLPFDYDVRLYNSGLSQLGISQNGGTTSETIIRNTSTAATYYIKVYGYNGNHSTTSCYTLRVNVGSSNFRSAVDNDEVSVDAVSLSDMLIYPNPANSTVNIEFNSDASQKSSICIFDMVGRTVHTEEFVTESGMNKRAVDLGDLVKGIYFIELNDSGSQVVKKLILEK